MDMGIEEVGKWLMSIGLPADQPESRFTKQVFEGATQKFIAVPRPPVRVVFFLL